MENQDRVTVQLRNPYSGFSGLNSKTIVKLYGEYLSENMLKNKKLDALKNQ
jgi:hypothetical protein